MRPEPKFSVKFALAFLGLIALAFEYWDRWRERSRE